MSDAGAQTKDLPFGVEEYRARLDRVLAGMAADGLDALVVAAPEDLYYLTGFVTMDMFRFQVLVLSPGAEPVMLLRIVSEMLFQQTSWTSRAVVYRDHEDPAQALRAVLAGLRVARGRIGVPTHSPYFTPYYLEQSRAAVPDAEWVDTSLLVARHRLVKSPAEIAYIRQAANWAEQGLLAGVSACRPGQTENHVAASMLKTMIEAGSETPAKNPLIGAGPRSALGFASWSGRRIEPGDVVFLEPGACARRYHATLMRCAVAGSPPPELEGWAEVSAAAANAAIAAMKPGVTSGEVDRACRSVVDGTGLGHLFRHRTGYSIGIGFSNWIEELSLRANDPTPLEPGMVFHVVPFLTDGRVGIAVSEMAVVTEHGAERVTTLPQRLLSAG